MLRPILSLLVFVAMISVNASFAANPATHNTALSPNTPTEKNLVLGRSFLQENAKHPGVITLPSGLQYKVHKEGEGSAPGPTDFVTVHYRGTLIDGTEFDNSNNRQMPTTFAVNAVIPGWGEALQLMKPGAKWTIYVPDQLAYGNRGVGRIIGPNATLIFDIELLSVRPSLDDNQDGTVDEFEDEG